MEKGLRGERGVEPIAMKIFAGLVLLVIGLGLGYAIYTGIKAPSFTVAPSPSSKTIGVPTTGENTVDDIQVELVKLLDYDEIISLSAEGVPDNVLVSFLPDSLKVNQKSTMTIKVGPNAPTGTHTINIVATGTDGVTASGAFTLKLV